MPAANVPRLVLTGAASPLADRVEARLRAGGADVVVEPARSGDLKRVLEGADAVVVVEALPADVAAVLDAAGNASVPLVVVTSTAAVYGAHADNPIPLTEDVPLRPNPGFRFALDAAEVERLVADWRDDHPAARATVLRLAPVLVPGALGGLADAMTRPSLLRPADSLPPVQALHVEDAASAIAHVVGGAVAGTVNVSPDDHVPGETARALSAAGVPVALPDRLATIAERWAWRLRAGGIEPAASSYRLHPWVVANDRLRATGWSPAYTSEEVLVACRKGSWWRELSPKRRQEVALGVVGAVLALAGLGVVLLVKKAGRRASP